MKTPVQLLRRELAKMIIKTRHDLPIVSNHDIRYKYIPMYKNAIQILNEKTLDERGTK